MPRLENLCTKVLSRISACYQLGLINEEQKNRLATLTLQGVRTGYKELFLDIQSYQGEIRPLDEIADWIIT